MTAGFGSKPDLVMISTQTKKIVFVSNYLKFFLLSFFFSFALVNGSLGSSVKARQC